MSRLLGGGSPFHEQQVFAREDGFATLIEGLAGFNHDSVRGPFRVESFLLDRHNDVDRISDKHRLNETEAVVAIGHSPRIDGVRRESDGDAENQSAVRHALAKWLRAAPFGVHVVGVEIAGLAGVNDNIGLGDRPAARLAALIDRVILKILIAYHAFIEPGRKQGYRAPVGPLSLLRLTIASIKFTFTGKISTS